MPSPIEEAVLNSGWRSNRTVDDASYGVDEWNYPLIYNEDTQVGTLTNSYLPVLNKLGFINLTTNEAGDSCAAGFSGFQCTATVRRVLGATFADEDATAQMIASQLAPSYKYMQSQLESPDIQKNFEYWNTHLTGKKRPQIPSKGSSIEDQLDAYATRYGAWHVKDIIIQKGGTLLWDRNADGKTNFTNLDLKEIEKTIGDFRVGDIVTLTRKDKDMKYSDYQLPGYAIENNVSHVGLIVGQDKDGVPLIRHSWNDGGVHKTKQERLTNMSTHAVSSILRVKELSTRYGDENNFSGKRRARVMPKAEPTATVTTHESSVLNIPSRLKSVTELVDHVSNFKPEEFNRLSNVSKHTTAQGKSYAIYDVSDEHNLFGSNFITKDTERWDGVSPVNPQKDNIKEVKKQKGGLIYKR